MQNIIQVIMQSIMQYVINNLCMILCNKLYIMLCDTMVIRIVYNLRAADRQMPGFLATPQHNPVF